MHFWQTFKQRDRMDTPPIGRLLHQNLKQPLRQTPIAKRNDLSISGRAATPVRERVRISNEERLGSGKALDLDYSRQWLQPL
jgi:hypothetical protein